jgi:hypothetical protein
MNVSPTDALVQLVGVTLAGHTSPAGLISFT